MPIKVTTPGGTATSTASFTVTTTGTNAALVISQVYGGARQQQRDLRERLRGTCTIRRPRRSASEAYSVQYASSKGTTYKVTKLDRQHRRRAIISSSRRGPAVVRVRRCRRPDVQGSIEMSATAGKVALVSSVTAITSHASAGVVDFVGYGTSASDYEGSGPAPAPSATTADLRAGNGKTDTNNNAADFATGTPNPRNSAFASTPVITSATTASCTVGTAFSYQITATASPTTYGVQGLPGGLTVNSSTGLLSGTPRAAGTFTLTLNAYNSVGKGSATLTLTVAQAVPVITSASTASGKVGTAFSYQIVATNSPTTYGVQGLPGGLTVDSASGLLSGTPKLAGTYSLTLNAYNGTGKGSAPLTLTVTN